MMRTNRIKNLIRRTRDRLTWPVAVVRSGDTLEITSDHWQRTHTITWPEDDTGPGRVRDIEYLHELAHAALCETVHPMFSTHYFARGIVPERVAGIAPAIRAANDWFADAWLMQRCPEDERSEIAEHYALVRTRLEREPSGPPELFYSAALIIAQASRYCGEEVNLDGTLNDAVRAFLAVDPDAPSIEKLEVLTNALINIVFPALRLRRVVEDGQEVWSL